MTFTVTYRDKTGAKREESIEAASRAECVAKCRKCGISPLSIREGGHAGRVPLSGERTTGTKGAKGLKGDGRVRRFLAVLGILAFLAILGGVTWWWLAARQEPVPFLPPEKPVSEAMPREIKPSVPSRPPKLHVGKTPKASTRSHVTLTTNEQGFVKNAMGYVLRKIEPPPAYTNDQSAYMPKALPDRVFSNPVDRKIGFLFDVTPGEFIFGVSENFVSRNFTKHFLKSLETPITIEADDPPEVAELKSAVIGAKEELKTLYGEGKDLRDVMMQCREDLRQLGLYRKELEKELDRIAKDRTLTESEMGQFVDAANKMLAERGATPLAMPRSAAKRFEMLRNADSRPAANSVKGQQEQKGENK